MIAVNPLVAAISAHRAAWEAFQVAPGGDESDESKDACCAMADALDALVLAACAFPILARPLTVGADALLAHLRWWLAEEVGQADSYQPQYGILQGRAADLAAVLEPPADPIFAALEAAQAAVGNHRATLARWAKIESPEADAACEAAGGARDAADASLRATLPTTLPGLAALAEYHLVDAGPFDGIDGGGALAHIVRALAGACAPAVLPVVEPDPIYPAIEAAEAARRAHQAIHEAGLDEDDDAQMDRLGALVDSDHEAFVALGRVMPTSAAGRLAVAKFYLRELDDPDGAATEHLEHLVAALARESSCRFPGAEYLFPPFDHGVARANPQQVFGGAR